jgi:hypothetical protein
VEISVRRLIISRNVDMMAESIQQRAGETLDAKPVETESRSHARRPCASGQQPSISWKVGYDGVKPF